MKKSTKVKPKNSPVIAIKKAATGKLCAKCGILETESGRAVCSKGHEHFDAEKCADYDDRSATSSAIFGGVTGLLSWGSSL